ncbi:DUF6586 family protein [Pseudomonas sp. 5P_3.1_Bac2]|uniref:DUF6586 family protein n=1 Tax=Pseudomonas sp. 5P_3.1_Bac2 TaxID=2971617 RepID=UPI0021CACA5D|nr:DUF6586 family protein [Pseudomonas sp. 5P_3.1_Bac2]MCU1716578.1 PasA protein [Pseudomonas sp. 5P_3.1_Bac2]
MANELYTRTNQKIFYAGLALESWRQAEQVQSMNSLALIQAEREAALFHLYGALLGLCHEIAGYYRLANSAAPQAESFLCEAVLAQAPSQELGELVELSQSAESWLAQLLKAYNQLFQPPRAVEQAQADPGLISALSLDQPQPLGHEALEQWRQHLKALAQRFRQTLSEW